MRALQNLLTGDHILRLKGVSFAKDRVCRACIEGKLHETSHPSKTIISSTRCLELLHMYLFGPPSHASLGGKKYCLVIVDDYSRYTWSTSLSIRVKLKQPSRPSQWKFNANTIQPS
jgi:hypothetical protein